MNYLVLFLLHNVLLQTVDGIELMRKWLRWGEINVSFGETIDSIESVSLMMCLAKCQEISGFLAANVNEANSQCELSAYYPPDRTKSATPRTGWTVYYKVSYEVQGARAFQTSDYADCVAENAIDGKFDQKVCPTLFSCGCRCAITNSPSSVWIVVLKSSCYIKAVAPYFRVDSANDHWRNTNFSIFVHESLADLANVGTLCVNYTGDPITSEISFSCPRAINGKVVKIFKDSSVLIDAIQLCEVKFICV